MGLRDHFKEEKDLHEQYNTEHDPKVSHELMGGAAAFTAAHEYEEHCKKRGEPVTHAGFKEAGAGLIGAFVDREAETKGLSFIEKEKVKHNAKKRAERGADAYGSSS